MKKWDIVRVRIETELAKTEALLRYLDDGWEPFAVAPAVRLFPRVGMLAGPELACQHWMYLRKEKPDDSEHQ